MIYSNVQQNAEHPRSSSAIWRWLGALFVGALVVALYLPVSNFAFLNFDDDVYVTANPHVNSGLMWANVVWAFTEVRGGHWHPLAWISHMIDVELFGLEPGPHHLMNVAWHAANAGLLFLIALRLTRSFGSAAFVAALFGLHPMRLESVAWISERKDVLSAFFGLLGVLAYLQYTERERWWRYLLTLACFSLGLLAKPTLVVFPALLLLIDFLKGRTSEGGRVCCGLPLKCWVEKLPLLGISIASCAVTLLAQKSEGALVQGLSVLERISNASLGYLAYLGKFPLPIGLGIFYPRTDYPPGLGAGAVLCLAGITALAIAERKRRPALTFAWLWFLIAPFPVIGLVQFGGQAFADRWSYLPHMGLLLGLASWGSQQERLSTRTCWAAGSLLVIIYATWTWLELPNWKDSIALFSHTLEVSPQNFMAHTNLGSALDVAGRLDEAAPHYEEALRLNPTYPEALNNMGSLTARRGQLTAAIQYFNRALSIRPNFPQARANLDLALRQIAGN